MSCNGLKRGSFHLFVHPKWSTINFWNNTFLTHFLTHFWSQNNPFSKHFATLEGPKWLANGLKMGSFHLYRHPKWGGPCWPILAPTSLGYHLQLAAAH